MRNHLYTHICMCAHVNGLNLRTYGAWKNFNGSKCNISSLPMPKVNMKCICGCNSCIVGVEFAGAVP